MANPAGEHSDEADDVRHQEEEDALERDFERMPPAGSRAFTARMLVDLGIMDGDEADRWKDEMKDAALFGDAP